MAGGFIYQKTIDSAYQGGTDKSLLIEPNYAYQVPLLHLETTGRI